MPFKSVITPEAIGSVHAESNHLQIFYISGNSSGHWICVLQQVTAEMWGWGFYRVKRVVGSDGLVDKQAPYTLKKYELSFA
jgi:hypothetical protein